MLLACRRQLRLYADAASIQAAVKEMNDPMQILSYYSAHADMDVASLGAVMSVLSKTYSSTDLVSMTRDTNFQGLLSRISTLLPKCDARSLSEFALAAGQFGMRSDACPELLEFSQKLAESACLKTNGFSPKYLTNLALGLAQRGIKEPHLIEFVRLEASKTLQDFSPQQLAQMLETCRRWGDFNRPFIDSITERMTDLVDRYNSKDVVLTINVMSKMALARGFLLRRLSKMAFDNLAEFDTTQIVYLLVGFARLRFLSIDECDDLIDLIDPEQLNPKLSSEFLIGCGLVGCTPPPELIDAAVKQLAGLSTEATADAAWGLCRLGRVADAQRLANEVLQRPPCKSRAALQEMLEISCHLSLSPGVAWRAAMDETDKLEQDRAENSKLHADVLLVLERVTLRKWSRNVIVGSRYRVDFYDATTKTIVDLDTLNRPVTRALKHAHLKAEGFNTVAIEYWKFRASSRTVEDQQKFFKDALEKM